MAKCTIKTSKAYSSGFDKAAKWPEYNFTDVVKKELGNKAYDCLVMSAPTVDITNLDTSKLSQSDNSTFYQQKVFMSCQNMFNSAQNSLKDYPNLKKVIIMEHAPRYDSKMVDPIGLKAALAKYANNVYNQLWLDSSFKNKISIGNHTLSTSSSGAIHEDSFRNFKTGNYDGVHFYGNSGKKVYTKSVTSILQKSLPNEQKQQQQESDLPQDYHQHKCPQAVYQKKQKKQNDNQSRYHPSVQVNNRFSVFNSNLGNL